MNRLATSGLALALAGTMIGCAPRYADVPAPVRFENSVQQKLQAAQHWRVIADHFARNIAEESAEYSTAVQFTFSKPDSESA